MTKHQARNKFQCKKLSAIGTKMTLKQLKENQVAREENRSPRNVWA